MRKLITLTVLVIGAVSGFAMASAGNESNEVSSGAPEASLLASAEPFACAPDEVEAHTSFFAVVPIATPEQAAQVVLETIGHPVPFADLKADAEITERTASSVSVRLDEVAHMESVFVKVDGGWLLDETLECEPVSGSA